MTCPIQVDGSNLDIGLRLPPDTPNPSLLAQMQGARHIERKLQAGEEVPGVAEPAAAATSTAAVSPPALPADLAKLKVAELKQLCRDRDLKVGGLKAVLIARLVDGE